MPVTSSGPGPLLKTYATLVTWVFRGLVLMAALLVATWLVIHGFIVPRIGELRAQLEAQATHRLGLPVRIGEIRGYSQGLVPSFELLDVRLLDRQGEDALRLPRVLATLTPQSLWQLGFEQLVIDQPFLEVKRSADGRLWLAGLDMQADGHEHGALDWLLAQSEVVVRQGQVQWTDEVSRQSLSLQAVDAVLQLRGRTHSVRIDATPPGEMGERLRVLARLRQPLFESLSQRSPWQTWSGEVFVDAPRLDATALPALGLSQILQGQGAARVWVEVQNGQARGLTADVSVSQLRLALSNQLPELSFKQIDGRVAFKPWGRDGQGVEWRTQGLQFTLADGLVWPGGNMVWRQASSVSESQGVAAGALQSLLSNQERSELSADHLDLQALAAIAQRVPALQALHAPLQSLAPRGVLERLQMSWTGSLGDMQQSKWQGRVRDLQLAAQLAAPSTTPTTTSPQSHAGMRPGVRGLTLDFEGSPQSGKARLQLQDGSITLPGWFDEPELPWQQLSADVNWQTNAGRLQVQVPNLKLNHADVQGEATIKWSEGASQPVGKDAARLQSGQLEVQGTLQHAELNRLHRYLPLDVSKNLRLYLRDALVRGQATGVKFRYKGDLSHGLFNGPKDAGSFRLSANIKDASLNPVPASLEPQARWPQANQINGELQIDHTRLQLKNIQARWGATSSMRVQRGDLLVANLLTPQVQLQADLRTPVGELLGTMRASTLQDLTRHVLDEATGSGNLEAQLKLTLPLQDTRKTQFNAKVVLAGVDLQMAPEVPALSRARGVLWLNESGLALQGVQARLLGGEATLEGGTMPVPSASSAPNTAPRPATGRLLVQGTATAEGLRELRLSALRGVLQRASGAAAYTAQIGLQSPTLDLQVNSNLQGMALNLPAPLGKVAAASLPLRLDITPLDVSANKAPEQDRVRLAVGRWVSALYIRDLGKDPKAEPTVRQGVLQLGEPIVADVPLPERGVLAAIDVALLDADAWQSVMDGLPTGATAAPGAALPGARDEGYLPRQISLKAQQLVWQGRMLHKLSGSATHEMNAWRAQVQAQELQGQLIYTPAQGTQAGRLFARLSRLSLAASTAKDVETLLDEQPVSMPALDIVVEDLELRGKRLGRVEIEAVNRVTGLVRESSREPTREPIREWQLQKFNIVSPDASFMASGRWGTADAKSEARSDTRGETKTSRDERRTSMNFKLDIADGGALLARLGMKDVMRNAKGRMEGQVGWAGSPLTPDYASMGGQFNVNIESGQFLKADPGIAKLLGVLSLQALPRRLTLDFRDVFSEGFAFDFIRGDVRIEQGMASTNNLQMKGVNAAVLMEGRADIARETQDLHVLVVPEINTGTAALIATYINPAMGLSSFLTQLLLRRPLIDSTTQNFQITGSWADPKIVRTSSKNESDKSSKDGAKP